MSSEGRTGHIGDLPALPSDWNWKPLRDLVDPSRGICYGIVQPGSHDPLGVPMVNSTEILGGCSSQSIKFRVSPELHNRFCRSELRGGELLVTLVGANFGQIATAPTYYRGYNVARPVGIVPVVDDADFVLYALRSPTARHLMNTWANTTAQPTLNLKDLGNLPIPIPPRTTSREIAGILKSLDDRIALLRETNATLEAIAQALFKSWFVDFDPVRAKMEGRAPEGMDEATAALFPDGFEESTLGPVPAGWSYVSLRDVVSIYDSRRVPLSGQERAKRRGVYPYYGAAALMDYVDDFLFDGVHLLAGEDGSVVDSSGRPILQYVWGRFWVNNHAHILQGSNGISTEHLMLGLREKNIHPFITGAVQAKLSQANMWRIQFLRPTRAIAESFGQLIAPLYAGIRQNTESTQTIATLRDTLLPRLISGQLRLPEAEALIEEAA